MYKRFYIILFILICYSVSASAQQRDTIDLPPPGRLPIPEKATENSGIPTSDTIPIPRQEKRPSLEELSRMPTTGSLDTLPPTLTQPDSLMADVPISDQGLPSEVDYGGDSTWYDAINSQYHLYGKAFVNYESMQLTAGYIIFDINNDIAEAYSIQNNRGRDVEQPTFVMGENTFKYKELKFNFRTKKGIVTDAITQDGEFFMHGSKTKFISKESDSLQIDDEIYNTDALITTCDLDHPHWGIRTNKLKIVPDKLAIIGFSQMEIAGIPTPFFLPFGFFPLVKGQSSGLILPNNYEFDRDLGLGFRDIGYYFPINDYLDFKVVGDIYTRGTYRIRTTTNYRKRYAYAGTVNLGYSSNRIEGSDANFIRNGALSINISHRQDSKAHPYRNIGGSINIQTDNYQRNNFNDAGSQLNNRLSSNFNFTHSMPGTPFSFRMGLSHDQNNRTRQVNITLPDIALNMNTIFPFKKTGGEEQWFEKISLRYNLAMKNLVRTTDTTLFTRETLDNMQTGISHDISSNASFNVAKYFTLTPNVNYDELWYFTTNRINFDPATIVNITDTIIDPEGREIILADTTYGMQVENIQRGFQPVRLFDAGFSLNTQIFGTKRFSRGFLRGIRHVIKPSLSFNFSPDSRSRYLEMVDTDSRQEFNDPDTYNPYLNGALRSPSLRQKQMAVNWSINNIIEGKYWSKKDSTEKKFKILRNLTVNGGYNFAADSLNWSDVAYSGTTNLFGLTNLVLRGRYTPYVYRDGRITSETLWTDRKKLLEFRTFNATFTTDITFKQIKNLFSKKKDDERSGSRQSSQASRPEFGGAGRGGENSAAFSQEDALTTERNEDETFEEGGSSFFDLFENFRISHRLIYDVRKERDGSKNGKVMVNSLTIRGNIPITDKWKLTLGNITYDFKNKSLVYPTLGISRNLHCWNMSFNWFPRNGVYSFFIGVNSSTFSFLKYNYGQNNAQNFFGSGGGNFGGPR